MQFDQIWRNLTNLAIIQGLISVGPNFETTKAFFYLLDKFFIDVFDDQLHNFSSHLVSTDFLQ